MPEDEGESARGVSSKTLVAVDATLNDGDAPVATADRR
ncbi:MAG: hypothetical protein QOG65_3360 [Actinomycetota bacterium]|jgi:hypothetical protein|nr:hypothetical protein [Actinomycetota bacterium]MDQ1385981.1 hypothetical protein [Actinomycetota bacterium]